MGNVTFDDDDNGQGGLVRRKIITPSASETRMGNFLIQKHIAKNKAEADIILLAFAAACVLLAGMIIYRGSHKNAEVPGIQNIPYEQV